ncbi:MAG: phosphotransferase enzyme family protein [Gelidibacter sp.]
MQTERLKFIFGQFDHTSEFDGFEELASGHINDTYLIKTKTKPYYVLQRINHGVFPDVPGLIENKVAISQHIKEKLQHLSPKKQKRRILKFFKTNTGASYFRGDEGNYWNLMGFIDKSVTHMTVPNEDVAYQGGRLLGQFLTLTNDFDAATLTEVIPNFHDMPFRYRQFEEALAKADKARVEKAKPYINLVHNSREEMHILQNLKESGEIKMRVTHNDTKISNVLFNKKEKGLCLIDLDTVMPGIVHYDFGDAIRTSCNTAAEDETNLDLVEFNLDYYNAFTKGFLKNMGDSLTPIELKYLPLGAKTMIFIIGLRFLTDYLNGDIYFKTKYDDHNLNRAKNQFKLLQSLSEKLGV